MTPYDIDGEDKLPPPWWVRLANDGPDEDAGYDVNDAPAWNYLYTFPRESICPDCGMPCCGQPDHEPNIPLERPVDDSPSTTTGAGAPRHPH